MRKELSKDVSERFVRLLRNIREAGLSLMVSPEQKGKIQLRTEAMIGLYIDLDSVEENWRHADPNQGLFDILEMVRSDYYPRKLAIQLISELDLRKFPDLAEKANWMMSILSMENFHRSAIMEELQELPCISDNLTEKALLALYLGWISGEQWILDVALTYANEAIASELHTLETRKMLADLAASTSCDTTAKYLIGFLSGKRGQMPQQHSLGTLMAGLNRPILTENFYNFIIEGLDIDLDNPYDPRILRFTRQATVYATKYRYEDLRGIPMRAPAGHDLWIYFEIARSQGDPAPLSTYLTKRPDFVSGEELVPVAVYGLTEYLEEGLAGELTTNSQAMRVISYLDEELDLVKRTKECVLKSLAQFPSKKDDWEGGVPYLADQVLTCLLLAIWENEEKYLDYAEKWHGLLNTDNTFNGTAELLLDIVSGLGKVWVDQNDLRLPE